MKKNKIILICSWIYFVLGIYLCFVLPFLPKTAMIILVPLILIFGFMLCSLSLFPFRFSVLGSQVRSHFPKTKPVYIKKICFFSGVGYFRLGSPPLYSVYVFESGVGISFWGFGKVYIPREKILLLNRNIFCHQINHNCAEVRGPIFLTNNKVVEAIQNMLKHS